MVAKKAVKKSEKIDISTVKGQDKAPVRKDPYYIKLSKGLSVGLWKSEKSRSWVARYRTVNKSGKRVYKTSVLKAGTYPQAVKAAGTFVEDADSGKLITREQKKSTVKTQMTVSELIAEYIEGSQEDRDKWEENRQEKLAESKAIDIGEYKSPMELAKGARYEEWKYTVKRLSKRYVTDYIGDKKIDSLEEDDIKSLQAILLGSVKASTVNRGTASLRSALNYGHRKGYLTKGAFWKDVPMEEETAPEDMEGKPFLDKETRLAFLEVAAKPLRDIVRCMAMTGCRPSEARRLTVGDVHADGRIKKPYLRLLTFKGNRKTGTPRKFQLTGSRLEFFRDLAKGRKKEEPLFITEKGIEWSMANLAKQHNAVRDKLELDKDVVTYCWRHSFIQDLVAMDVHTLKIAKLVGTSEKHIRDNYTSDLEINPDELPEL